MRADRLLRLIVLLQRHGRATAGWLAEQLEVSERTILRDMEALSAAGVPVYTERGPQGGCVLLEGFTTDASGLTTSEAQALFAWTSRESVADLGLGPQLSGALAKVAASASSSVVEHAEALGAVLLSDRRRWFADAEQVPVLPVLREAAQAGRRLRLTYRSAGAAGPGARTVDPYGLVDQSGVWYLVATHRGQDRTFRVSRIVSVEVLDQPSRLPPGSDLAEVWARLRRSFESERRDPVTVEVVVDPASGPRLPLGGAVAAGHRHRGRGAGTGRRRGAVAAPAAGSAPRPGRGARLGARRPSRRPRRRRGRRTTAGGAGGGGVPGGEAHVYWCVRRTWCVVRTSRRTAARVRPATDV